MNNHFCFVGGARGQWRVTHFDAVAGAALPSVERVAMMSATARDVADSGAWTLQGFTSNVRYANRAELQQLAAIQEPLGRPDATCAALIPIRKNAAWWALSQDERREIFEERSHHNAIGLRYLPAVARQLHHCRDLGEPFDFLTWFEWAPQHTSAFDDMVAQLRANPEWDYVEREVDIRLERAA